MKVSIGAKTDPGRRPNNEDNLVIIDVERHKLRAESALIVADGMGGRNFGEKASEIAVETVQETLIDMLALNRSFPVGVKDAIGTGLRKANARVYQLSQEDPENDGMGTTCIVAVVSGDRLYVGHAGDSRAYLMRQGYLEQLTEDHSYVAEQVRAGALTEETARKSRFRNMITRAVGIEPMLSPDVAEYDLQDVEALLLCTDGLSNMVPDSYIERILCTTPSAQAATEKLVDLANKNGGSDNITAVVTYFGNGPTQRNDLPELDDLDQAGQWVQPRNTSAFAQFTIWSLLIFFLAATIYLVNIVYDAGFIWKSSPPFLIKPYTPAQPRHVSKDLTHVAYFDPKVFYFMPVRSGPLTENLADNSVSAVTAAGEVITLASDGTILYRFPLPQAAGKRQDNSSTKPSDAGLEGNLHFASDSQSNLYVSNASAGTIMKYRASGEYLGQIAEGKLAKPEAIVVAEDGAIFVVDAGRLEVISPKAAT